MCFGERNICFDGGILHRKVTISSGIGSEVNKKHYVIQVFAEVCSHLPIQLRAGALQTEEPLPLLTHVGFVPLLLGRFDDVGEYH